MPDETKETTAPDLFKDVADLKAANADLLARLEKLSAKPDGSSDLHEKAAKLKETDAEVKSNEKSLEDAIRFSVDAPEFLKKNASLLPKETADIFTFADKENYSGPIEKDKAIKSGIIQSFFSVQSNVDNLTSGQKNNLEEYLKLTKTGKQERAQEVYKMIFEPAVEILRREKRADALRSGLVTGSSSEDAYKQRLINGSKKHYLGEES